MMSRTISSLSSFSTQAAKYRLAYLLKTILYSRHSKKCVRRELLPMIIVPILLIETYNLPLSECVVALCGCSVCSICSYVFCHGDWSKAETISFLIITVYKEMLNANIFHGFTTDSKHRNMSKFKSTDLFKQSIWSLTLDSHKSS